MKFNNLKLNNEKKYLKKFNKIFLEMTDEIKLSNNTLNVLNDEYKFNFINKKLSKFKKFKSIALVGMGGSILGTEAIFSFLKRKLNKKVFFFNNLDESKLISFKIRENLSKILFIIISKSGNTIETLSNAFFLNIIKKNSKNVIIISEKKNNTLFSLAKKFNLEFIEHNSFVGGRYSVLSEVGIIPTYLTGLNTLKLRSKINSYLNKNSKNPLKENAIKLAASINSKKINNMIFLNYCPELEKFLFWCQQLIAESLGKNNKGFLPVISNAPKDHHSLLQLYLDGPKDKIFNIFSLESSLTNKIFIKKENKFSSFLNNKKLSSIKNAQKKALIKTFIENKIPYREFKIKSLNEEELGKLFSYFILETVAIAKLTGINPYNQPAVEQVKIFTKKILS
tara:strand:- start:7735 stop:8919 length:1185 start_codon:yes stop_codon:yes gene_type:complete